MFGPPAASAASHSTGRRLFDGVEYDSAPEKLLMDFYTVGSQAQKPLAIVVVGGMTAAMILPQFLIPVLYTFFPAPGPRSDVEL